MALKNTIKAVALTSLDVSSLNSAFKPINASGLDEACFMIRLSNNSNKDLLLSFDGITTHEVIFSTSEFPNNVIQLESIPSQSTNAGAAFKKGQIVYAIAASGGSGSIYLSGYYQD